MNREQMIEKAAEAIADYYDHPAESYEDDARRVVDALLPQVTTVEELEALPPRTVVVGVRGVTWVRGDRDHFPWVGTLWGSASSHSVIESAPLLVAWQP